MVAWCAATTCSCTCWSPRAHSTDADFGTVKVRSNPDTPTGTVEPSGWRRTARPRPSGWPVTGSAPWPNNRPRVVSSTGRPSGRPRPSFSPASPPPTHTPGGVPEAA
jgi:hypothetical protein